MDVLGWLVRLLRLENAGSAGALQTMSEQEQRLRRFRTAWDAYYGRFPKPLKVKKGKPDDNVIVNFARIIVEKSVDFLFGKEIRLEIVEGEETEAEAWLRAAWEANGWMGFLQRLAIGGSVTGQVFVKLLPPDERTRPYPRLVAVDAGLVDVTWAPDDVERVTAYTIMYPAGDRLRRQVIAQGENGQWTIADQERPLSGGSWVTVKTVAWPWPFAPMVHAQNLPLPNEFWGMSDLGEDVLGLNRALNFLLSHALRIVRYHAHPKTWGRGFRRMDMDLSVDNMIILPSERSELGILTAKGDLSGAVQVYRAMVDALLQVARTPEVSLGKVENLGNLSGVALRVLYEPLLEKTETKRRLYGALVSEVSRRMLVMGGHPSMRVRVHWPELLPQDPMALRQAAVIDKELGVSTDTLLRKLGYDPEVEQEKTRAQMTTEDVGEALLRAFDGGKGEGG